MVLNCIAFRKSTRPDIVSVEAVNPDSTGCSERALVTAKAKHKEEHNAVVFADNKGLFMLSNSS